MKSSVPKVLHTICGKTILEYSLDLARGLNIKPIVVLGHKNRDVRQHLAKDIKIVYQKNPKGTADAIKCARGVLRNFSGSILIIYADNPLVRPWTIKALLDRHLKSRSDCTLLSSIMQDPRGYGRVVRDNFSNIIKVVEEQDASVQEKAIREINTGICCFTKNALFSNLAQIRPDNVKKEYYLTDIISILRSKNSKIESYFLEDTKEAIGINSRQDLIAAQGIMHLRIINQHIDQGVTIFDPSNTYIDADVNIGLDTKIYPFTVIETHVRIGANCSIGPFCRLRSHTLINDNVEIGNFVEISRSKVGKNSYIKHFGYLGDAILGKKVNIGAGSVTANFDGRNKNITRIQDGAFIGCDTVIVAPAKIGRRSITGAGSVIVKNRSIPDNSVVVGVPARLLKKKR